MSSVSISGSFEPQLRLSLPAPLLSTQQQPPILNTEDLRQQLKTLDSESQNLRANQAQLEAQLESLRTRIAANDSVVQVMMEQLDQQVLEDQRAERQSAFRGTVLGTDNVIEALRHKAREDGELKSALLAIVTNRATADDNNKVGAALLTEMSGDVLPFLHDVAARILECDNDNDPALMEVQTVDEDEFDMPAPAEEPDQLPTMPPMRSPSVKSEASSVQAVPSITRPFSTMINASAARASLERISRTQPYSHLASSVEPLARPLLQAQRRPAAPARPSQSQEPDPAGLTRLEKNFPGLLDSLRVGQELLNPKNTPAAKTKRARESVESDASGTATATGTHGTHGKQVKKPKLEKEPAYTPNFATFIKRLESIHRQGGSIASLIRCPRCQHIKSKCRILSCLHLYCHKCVLALRTEAEKGNAVTGFRAFCVKPDCDAEVSGKTSVVESEAMSFLKWYDDQPACLTSTAAQLHILNGALEDFPDEHEIQRKLSVVQAQAKHLKRTNQADAPADLLQLVKLARKPY
ncbi:hypothetical protein A1O1_03664 [Capronia coronata CBS 617.96]|uniref:RING-type domain-containing protein n=1 Tax=Capronia coronata CBS 617.96 TaxID=1182541 RepID=W9YMU6_9EURO|nr:uncharacterized protein A1O1_03664 [Capronia coronata CBS 617.96]EXJ90561.1 hypothetical protein A1O1_03664 [Capronia coronata CBS 617.96]